MSLFDLTGQVAVVTGGTKGIGRGIVEQMVLQGSRVVVSSRSQGACDQTAAELNAAYGNGKVIAKGIACDIDRLPEMERLAAGARKAWGRVDTLVCNAAVLPYIGEASQTPRQQFNRILTSNIHNNFRLCAALRTDLAKQGGAIIMIGSISGHTAAPRTMAYSVAKAGIAHMARCMADDMAGDGIRVNCVSPGLIRSASSTEMLGEEGFKAASSGFPLRRVGEPEDIAGAVIFLASRAGSYVTGNTILVDGGRTFLSSSGGASDVSRRLEEG